MQQINLAELTEVPNITRRKKQNYHLRYIKDGRFRISDSARVTLNVENNGLKLHIHPSTGAVILSSQNEEDSDFMKRRGDFDKGAEFTNRKMRKYLNKAGYKDTNFFKLDLAGTKDGVSFYVITPWVDTEEDDEFDSIEGAAAQVEDVEEEEEEDLETEDLEDEDEDVDEADDEADDLDLDEEEEEEEDEEDPFK